MMGNGPFITKWWPGQADGPGRDAILLPQNGGVPHVITASGISARGRSTLPIHSHMYITREATSDLGSRFSASSNLKPDHRSYFSPSSSTIMHSSIASLALLATCSASAFWQLAAAAPSATDCTGTISSMSDVAAAVKCTTVNINAFTVPAGETFDLELASGTTVNMSTSSFLSFFYHRNTEECLPSFSLMCSGRRDIW